MTSSAPPPKVFSPDIRPKFSRNSTQISIFTQNYQIGHPSNIALSSLINSFFHPASLKACPSLHRRPRPSLVPHLHLQKQNTSQTALTMPSTAQARRAWGTRYDSLVDNPTNSSTTADNGLGEYHLHDPTLEHSQHGAGVDLATPRHPTRPQGVVEKERANPEQFDASPTTPFVDQHSAMDGPLPHRMPHDASVFVARYVVSHSLSFACGNRHVRCARPPRVPLEPIRRSYPHVTGFVEDVSDCASFFPPALRPNVQRL